MSSSDSQNPEISARVALCLAAITMVGIDGQFKNEELDKLRTLIADDEHAFTDAIEIYNWRKLEQCIDLVAQHLNEVQKRVVLKILFEYAHIDQEFDPTEEALLKQYGSKFGFPENALKEIYSEPTTPGDLQLFNA